MPVQQERPFEFPIVPWVLATLVALAVGFPWPSPAIRSLASSPDSAGGLPCKYSVRDAGFVDVHGRPWQLQLIKPATIDAARFAQWEQSLQSTLQRTNLSHIWLDSQSEEAARIIKRFKSEADSNSNADRQLLGAMVSRSGEMKPIISESPSSADGQYAQLIDSLVGSPTSTEIIDAASKRLCVLVTFHSGDATKDRLIDQVVADSVTQLKQQMWMLEKPVDLPPTQVTVSHSQLSREGWLAHSLEIDPEQLPAVAIVYGQGRRLGNVMSGDQLTTRSVVAQASISGSDCECDLDREWLYGCQMLHRWTLENERTAETTLNFDPNSVIVRAEVAQIVRKAGSRRGFDPTANPGVGLVIHDLESLEKKSETDPAADSNPEQDSKSISADPAADRSDTQEAPVQDPPETTRPPLLASVPWSTIGFMIVFVALVGIYVFFRGRAASYDK